MKPLGIGRGVVYWVQGVGRRMHMDHAELVKQAIAGQPLALDRLLLEAYPKLLARVEQKLPPELRRVVAAEDVIQEAFTYAFRGIGGFRPEGADSFYRWLTAIADNRMVDALRMHNAAKRGGGKMAGGAERSSIAALIELVAVNDWTPSRSAGGHEAAAAVQVALAGLKPEYRAALSVRYLEGLTAAEAAGRLGTTEGALHKMCSRALHTLRESMGEAEKYLSRGG